MDIKSVIQRHGMQIQEVALKIGIKQSTLSGMLAGNPTVKTLRLIAENCGCSIAEFFFDELPADFEIPSLRDNNTIENENKQKSKETPGLFVCPNCGAGVQFSSFVVKDPSVDK